VATITQITLQNTWTEGEHYRDICHVTRSARCIMNRLWDINFPFCLPVIWTPCTWFLELVMLKL
jgi:hypothetical protein